MVTVLGKSIQAYTDYCAVENDQFSSVSQRSHLSGNPTRSGNLTEWYIKNTGTFFKENTPVKSKVIIHLNLAASRKQRKGNS